MLPGEGSAADPIARGLAWSLPPSLVQRLPQPAMQDGDSPPHLACGPMAKCSLPGDTAACRDSTDGLGGLESSTHLLSVQYLVYCKSKVQ